MKSSPERNTFQRKQYLDRCREKGQESNADYLGLFDDAQTLKEQREAEQQFQKNNLEYDLRSTEWICDKAKARDEYAQNIYAALCNQSWQKNEVWPLLQNKQWSCSWRYAGGIVADMRETGDYMDWYCSGIRGGLDQHDKLTPEQQARVQWYDQHFVGEGVVTDEVREDFFALGWIPVEDPVSK